MQKQSLVTKDILRAIIKNTYRTLMTRGMKGCYVYCVDKELEKYSVNYGTVITTGEIEQHKLYNGLRIFTRTLTVEKKQDENYTSRWYQVVSIVVPDKIILQKPLQVSLTLFGKNSQQTNAINTYILNSISLPGKLSKPMLIKIKDSYME